MITLKTKLSYNQFKAFTEVLNEYMKYSFDLFQAGDYIHYYNIRNIAKNCALKIFKLTGTNSKIILSLNLNEYESLKIVHLQFWNSTDIIPDPFAYHTITNGIIYNFQKQIVDLNHRNLYQQLNEAKN